MVLVSELTRSHQMSGLKTVLERTTTQRLTGGGVVSASVVRALRLYRSRQLAIFVTLYAVLICGLVLCVYVLISHPARTTSLRALSGLVGIGSGGVIEVMRRLWREYSQTDLLLILTEDASEAQITTIIDRLIKKL